MSWSVAAGSTQRMEAIVRLAEVYLSDSIAEDERAATEQVFVLYLNDPCIRVRCALAKAMAGSESAPRVLLWGLSQDVAEVASIVIQASPLLKPVDLIDTVKRDDPVLQTAVARRKHISGDVVRALVETGREEAVLALLENPNVVLGPGLVQDIAARLGHDMEIRNLLLKQDDLPPSCRHLLVQQLSRSLYSLVCDNGWVVEQTIADTTRDAANRSVVEIASQIDNQSMRDYVEHLVESKNLTPALLVRAICEGNAALFETAISVISGVSLKKVQAIIDSNRPTAWRALYNRTELPENVLPVIQAALAAWKNADQGDSVLMDILSRLNSEDAEIDSELYAMLRRMVTEEHAQSAQNYERQLLLAAA